tara:strand:- start:317 stop:637 length:321 start_codon:yes stop_codon:yes gene_type:complete
MTNKILTHVSCETLPKKEDINDMFYELFGNHSKEDGIDLEIIQIVAMKMFLRETCKQFGLLTKVPFNLKPNDAYEMFGKHIADEINDKVDDINHMAKLERMIGSIK